MSEAAPKKTKIAVLAEKGPGIDLQLKLARATHLEIDIDHIIVDLEAPQKAMRQLFRKRGEYTHLVSEFFYRNPRHNVQTLGGYTRAPWGLKLLRAARKIFPHISICFRSILSAKEIEHRLKEKGFDQEIRVFHSTTSLECILQKILDNGTPANSSAPAREPPRTHRNRKKKDRLAACALA